MSNRCEICSTDFTLFTWHHKCTHCNKEVCRKHFEDSLCSSCHKNAMNVIIISGPIPTDAIYSNATSVGLITKSNAISERAVLCELKIEAFKRGADAIVNYKQSTDNGHATYANSGIGPLPIKFDHYCAQGEAIRLKN